MNNETTVKAALTGALANVMNYPEGVSHVLLGRDMSKVIEAATKAVMESGAVETVDDIFGRPQVDRVEVIDATGRAYINMGAVDVATSLQDSGRTLKIFLREGK